MIRLKIEEAGSSRSVELTDEAITIGRSTENTITLADKKCSRKHAKLEVGPGGLTLTDLGSSNGTRVNGNKVDTAALRTGDAVTIGEARIVVESMPVAAEAAPAGVGSELVTKEPVSQAERADFKRKVEQRRSALDVARERKPAWKKAGIAAAVLVGVAVVTILAIQQMKNPPAVVPKKPAVADNEPVGRQDQADQELARLRHLIDAAPRVTDRHMTELRDLAAKFDSLYYADTIESEKYNPFDALISALLQRRAQEYAAAYMQGSQRFGEALARKHYARAHEEILALKRRLGEGVMVDLLMQLQNEWQDTIRKDVKGVEDFAIRFKNAGRFGEAERFLLKHLGEFKDTRYEEQLSLLATAIRVAGEAAVSRPPRPIVQRPPVSPPIARTDPPPDKPAPTDPTAEPPVQPEPKLAPVVARLLAGVQAGDITGRTFAIGEDKKGAVESADAAGITLSIDGEPEKMSWSDLRPQAFHDMLAACKLASEDRVPFALWCYENELRMQGDKQLYKYWKKRSSGSKERKAELDTLLASVRLEALPDGGYRWHSKYGFENPIARLNREALADAEKMTIGAGGIAKTSSGKTLKKKFEKVFDMINDPQLTEKTRMEIEKMLVDSLKAHRTLRMKAIRRNARRDGAFKNLMAAKKALDEARKEAIKVIYDRKIYPDEDHGRVGQPKVDEMVNAVRDLWEAKNISAIISPSLSKEIRAVQAINDDYLAQLGAESNEAELKEFDDFVNNITDTAALGMQTVAASGGERDRYRYNKLVSRFNNELFELPAGVPRSAVKQAEANNTYRNMMGRRKLFMQGQLSKAAQFHTENMASAGRIWHNGEDGTPGSRCQKEGFSGPVGENCAMGYPDPERVHWGWYNSSGHHRNMLSSTWNCIGVGNQGRFWTQNFGVGAKPGNFPSR